MNPEDHADPELIEMTSGLANPPKEKWTPSVAAYELQTPVKSLALEYKPLRKRLSGPETHVERMARTDRQLEEEKLARALHEALVTQEADWAEVRGACAAQCNAPACAVLALHFPVLDNCIATCNECCQCDYYGEAVVEWPCNTFREIKRLVL